MNSPVPLPKVRAVSPNCIRPAPKPITPLQQPPSQFMPRGPISNIIRPPVQQMPTPVPSVPATTAKIRVRAPIVQTSVPRPTVLTRPPVSQYSQVLEVFAAQVSINKANFSLLLGPGQSTKTCGFPSDKASSSDSCSSSSCESFFNNEPTAQRCKCCTDCADSHPYDGSNHSKRSFWHS